MTEAEEIAQLKTKLEERDQVIEVQAQVISEMERMIRELQKMTDETIPQLQREMAKLKAQVKKDSHNSSKPPASDGLGKRTHSQRAKGTRPSGGQRGHEGQTLKAVTKPDAVVTYRPIHCGKCQHPVENLPGVVTEERQVYDLLPPMRV